MEGFQTHDLFFKSRQRPPALEAGWICVGFLIEQCWGVNYVVMFFVFYKQIFAQYGFPKASTITMICISYPSYQRWMTLTGTDLFFNKWTVSAPCISLTRVLVCAAVASWGEVRWGDSVVKQVGEGGWTWGDYDMREVLYPRPQAGDNWLSL